MIQRFSPGSPNSITSLPEEQARRSKTSHSQTKIELNDGPDPETPERRGLLQDSNIAKLVRDVNQIASCGRSHRKEYGLSGMVLKALG